MKTSAQLLLGIASSLLLAAGFASAAEKIDPVTTQQPQLSANCSNAFIVFEELPPKPCYLADEDDSAGKL